MMQNSVEDQLLAELGQKYIWWTPVGDAPHAPDRIIAQVMNIGSDEDTQRLQATVGAARLADVMMHAAAGWFSPRSWNCWRERLSAATSARIPAELPRRPFLSAQR
jgi:hypothetical protein